MKFISYLKYSGIAIIFTLNPFHWSWMPFINVQKDLAWDDETYVLSILFLSIRVWIDDGSW